MLREMEKSLKFKVNHKLLLYVILLCSIHRHQIVIAYQDASFATRTLQLNETIHPNSKQNNGSSPIPDQSDESSSGSYDLVLHGESNWSGLTTTSTTSQRQDELAKHTYNVTRTIAPSSASLATRDNNNIAGNKTEGGDDLSVSDSRLIAKSANAKRSDEDVGDYMASEDDVQPPLSDFYNAAVENYADASSDLIEQKVMKELTKLLSKGMAGATDKVKLEKLESWKRRQKERKVMKDNRAKLFEDLLTAAINTHPEEAKKKSKKRTGTKDGSKVTKSSVPILGDALQNVDPELAQDAESVLQHLQGISSVFDSPAQVESLDDSNSSSESETTDDSQTSEVEKGSNRKTSADRPLVRSIKKIKQQFKHRRNQLDQIKKIFNVELAINPKDGSLVGKASNKKKEHREVGDFNIYDDSTINNYPSTSRSASKKKKGNKISKMNELSAYLMENPEILASVMAELTIDSGPSRPSLESSGSSLHVNENTQADYLSDQPKIITTSRKLSNHYSGFDDERLTFDSHQNLFNPLGPSDLNSSEFTQRLGNRYRRHNSNHSLQASSSSYAPGGAVYHEKTRNITQTISPTETLLLKALRERQLMNLMRLEMLMAERQQSSSNRSNSYANRSTASSSSSLPPHSSSSFGLDERDGESSSPRSSSSTNKYPHMQRQQSTAAQKNQTNDEVLHHFMVMNPNTPLKLRQKWIEQQVEQQDNSNGGNHQSEAINSQNESPNRTLSRFKDWRDASSRSSDATPSSSSSMYRQPMDRVRGNITSSPYDLFTGSSSKSIDSTASKKMNDFDNSYNDKAIVMERLGRDYSDFSITRSGLKSYDRSQPRGKSMFMTRSSVAHDESTTSPSIIKDEQQQLNEELSEESLMANDEKNHAVEAELETTKENPDISQEEIEDQLMATDKPKAPIDYFSSYKNEYASALNVKRRLRTKTKAGTTTATTTDKARNIKSKTAEDLGGMWA